MQLIAWKDSSPNDLLCVEWDVKPYTLTHSLRDTRIGLTLLTDLSDASVPSMCIVCMTGQRNCCMPFKTTCIDKASMSYMRRRPWLTRSVVMTSMTWIVPGSPTAMNCVKSMVISTHFSRLFRPRGMDLQPNNETGTQCCFHL